MARATISPLFVSLFSTKLRHFSSASSHPFPTHLSLPPHHHNFNLTKNCSIRVSEEDRSELDEAFFDGEDLRMEYDESDDEEETESSVDLLIRFLQSTFRKISKRAKKASRSVLPPAISPQLVSFAVDGVLLLASLSIIKALLQVACTLGGTLFVVILVLRGIAAAVSYFQSSGLGFNQNGGSSYGTSQPI